MEIGVASLTDADVRALITEHQQRMFDASPPGTSFALDLSGLDRPDVTLFAARFDRDLLGIGAMRELSSALGEIKSMRTADAALRRGVGEAILRVILETARTRQYEKVVLETGTGPVFEPANRLYQRNGFVRCDPFGEYVESDFNVFYEKTL